MAMYMSLDQNEEDDSGSARILCIMSDRTWVAHMQPIPEAEKEAPLGAEVMENEEEEDQVGNDNMTMDMDAGAIKTESSPRRKKDGRMKTTM